MKEIRRSQNKFPTIQFKLVLFLSGIVIGTVFYMSATWSSTDKYQRAYRDIRLELEMSQKYNFLGEEIALVSENYECSLDYINENKLQQDHPCVIQILKRDYLIPPPSPGNSPVLKSAIEADHSLGKTPVILRLLHNQTNGFFLDYGAGDGEAMSSTLDLEMRNGWSGLLIEPNPKNFEMLQEKKRNSWTLPACLSTTAYPIREDYFFKDENMEIYRVQCFPLYSILLAAGQTEIDFINLNAEGREVEMLKAVPWHKVFIKSLAVNKDSAALTYFLQGDPGFTKANISLNWIAGVVYVKA